MSEVKVKTIAEELEEINRKMKEKKIREVNKVKNKPFEIMTEISADNIPENIVRGALVDLEEMYKLYLKSNDEILQEERSKKLEADAMIKRYLSKSNFRVEEKKKRGPKKGWKNKNNNEEINGTSQNGSEPFKANQSDF